MDGKPAGDRSMILVLLDMRGEPLVVLGGGSEPAPPPSMPSAHDKPEAGVG